MFVLAKNKGGAWGLLQGQSENVRRPFFLLVSVAAIAFIVTLYRRLQPRQHALKWGLPLVLGGALGNVFDRIRYGYVIDFIDYRADWIKKLNELIQKKYPGHIVTDHWPTFNVADIAICVGVALMAIDMLTSRRGAVKKPTTADVPIEPVTEPLLVTENAPTDGLLATEAAAPPPPPVVATTDAAQKDAP
jgi:signal peptidase II